MTKVLDIPVGTVRLSKEAIQLLGALKKENNQLKDFLLKSYRGLSVSPEMEEKAYNYFISHSVITAATVANRGSSVTTEFLYDEDGSRLPSHIDRYFLQAKAGRAVKARLAAIEKELFKIIEEYRRKKDNVLIGNLGSGPGRDVINTLCRYRHISNVKAVNIDKDGKALERGKRMAMAKGVDHLIEFVETDFLRYRPVKKFDIVLLIGVLCPLEIKTCIIYLRALKRLLVEDGCLIAGNASKKMLEEDPFTCYLMEWTANWKLVYKDEEEMKQLYREAGYVWKRCFLDSYGFHIMGVGTPT